MSTISHSPPTLTTALLEPTNCHTAHFATRWVHPDTSVVTAHGEIDTANAQEFVNYALRHADLVEHLVVDLSGVDFFGTAGFSALHTLNTRAVAEGIEWTLVPSASVSRLLRLCDPDSILPVSAGVDAALSTVQGRPQPLLQLVPQSH
ncbi:STAS domain-containing protein [Mycobacterium sp. IDR2000157661]|uniref:STAS domain-containing protein n=1 Tax=Mycobacterium sp. IDR2000157661 TaxID=2867005 RepID=UPI001EEC5AB9|nr:STAS domain-containing protein [Mycobacterium sp. IDR2000157661]ULE33649.1 STAS domain-containing protein [Mycobacterium sp. IDR2000157661]